MRRNNVLPCIKQKQRGKSFLYMHIQDFKSKRRQCQVRFYLSTPLYQMAIFNPDKQTKSFSSVSWLEKTSQNTGKKKHCQLPSFWSIFAIIKDFTFLGFVMVQYMRRNGSILKSLWDFCFIPYWQDLLARDHGVKYREVQQVQWQLWIKPNLIEKQ